MSAASGPGPPRLDLFSVGSAKDTSALWSAARLSEKKEAVAEKKKASAASKKRKAAPAKGGKAQLTMHGETYKAPDKNNKKNASIKRSPGIAKTVTDGKQTTQTVRDTDFSLLYEREGLAVPPEALAEASRVADSQEASQSSKRPKRVESQSSAQMIRDSLSAANETPLDPTEAMSLLSTSSRSGHEPVPIAAAAVVAASTALAGAEPEDELGKVVVDAARRTAQYERTGDTKLAHACYWITGDQRVPFLEQLRRKGADRWGEVFLDLFESAWLAFLRRPPCSTEFRWMSRASQWIDYEFVIDPGRFALCPASHRLGFLQEPAPVYQDFRRVYAFAWGLATRDKSPARPAPFPPEGFLRRLLAPDLTPFWLRVRSLLTLGDESRLSRVNKTTAATRRSHASRISVPLYERASFVGIDVSVVDLLLCGAIGLCRRRNIDDAVVSVNAYLAKHPLGLAAGDLECKNALRPDACGVFARHFEASKGPGLSLFARTSTQSKCFGRLYAAGSAECFTVVLENPSSSVASNMLCLVVRPKEGRLSIVYSRSRTTAAAAGALVQHWFSRCASLNTT